MKKDREKRKERQKVSAKNRVAKHETFSNTSIRVPDGVSLFQIKKEGSYRLDIIPYEVSIDGNPFADKGTMHFERTFYTHRGVGPNNDSYVCLAKTFKKPCPICEHRAKLAKEEDTDEDTIKALSPKERQLWNVYDHANPDKGVQLWEVSYHLFGKALDAKIKNADEDDNYDAFADPEDGFTLKIGATEEKGGGYSYMDCSDIEFKKRKEAVDDEILEAAIDLDSLIKEVDYDELKKIFLQIDDEGKKGKSKSKKSKDEDSEDDEEDLDETDDEDEDEKPSKKKKSKKDLDDEEEDDEDSDETDDESEDDDEPPKKKKKGKKDLDDEDESDSDDESEDDEDSDQDDESDDEDEPPKKKKKGKEPTAAEQGIKLGMTVIHEDMGECEVIKISKDGTSLTLEDEDGEMKSGIGPEEVEVKKKGKKKEEEDDEDDPEDDEKPKKGKKKKKQEEDDEEEDDD